MTLQKNFRKRKTGAVNLDFPCGLLLFLWRKSCRGNLGQVIWFISIKGCFLFFIKIPAPVSPNERFWAK